MDAREILFSLANIGVAVIAAWFLFHKNPRQTLVSRAPLFIVCFLLFFSAGVANLPLAFPALFQRVLGHSVWMNYMPSPKLNVIQVGGTWWVVRWRDPIQSAYFFSFLAGMVWATVNLVQRRAWKANLFCVTFGVLLFAASVVVYLSCFPFCV